MERWQHIRALEMGQLQQQEIIRLKELLKAKDEERGMSKSTYESQKAALKKIILNMKKTIFLLKSDLSATKKEFSIEITAAKEEYWKLKTSTKELELRCGKGDKHMERMHVEIELLRRQIDEYEDNRRVSQAKSAAESDTYQKEIGRLADDLKRALLDCSMKDKALSTIRGEKDVLSEKFDLSRAKVGQLQQAMRKMQDDGKLSIDEMQRQHNLKCVEYEERIASLLSDNAEMSEDIAHLQKEIEKLIAAQNAPKKSNFSKYVELKAENAQLQAQMEEISRRQSVMGSRRMSQQPPVLASTTGEQLPISRRASNCRKQSSLGMRLPPTGDDDLCKKRSSNNDIEDKDKSGVLTSRSARETSDNISGNGQQYGDTAADGTNAKSDALLPPRRSSRSRVDLTGIQATTTASVLAGGDEVVSSTPSTRRHSMNDDSIESDSVHADSVIGTHRMTPPPPSASHPNPTIKVAVAMPTSSTSNSTERKIISPRPSQYRTDSNGAIKTGDSSAVASNGGPSEPPVYMGLSGSNLRKKSVVGSSLPRERQSAGPSSSHAVEAVTDRMPRRTVVSFNQQDITTLK